jgi:hypothetical protein
MKAIDVTRRINREMYRSELASDYPCFELFSHECAAGLAARLVKSPPIAEGPGRRTTEAVTGQRIVKHTVHSNQAGNA